MNLGEMRAGEYVRAVVGEPCLQMGSRLFEVSGKIGIKNMAVCWKNAMTMLIESSDFDSSLSADFTFVSLKGLRVMLVAAHDPNGVNRVDEDVDTREKRRVGMRCSQIGSKMSGPFGGDEAAKKIHPSQIGLLCTQ